MEGWRRGQKAGKQCRGGAVVCVCESVLAGLQGSKGVARAQEIEDESVGESAAGKVRKAKKRTSHTRFGHSAAMVVHVICLCK